MFLIIGTPGSRINEKMRLKLSFRNELSVGVRREVDGDNAFQRDGPITINDPHCEIM